MGGSTRVAVSQWIGWFCEGAFQWIRFLALCGEVAVGESATSARAYFKSEALVFSSMS